MLIESISKKIAAILKERAKIQPFTCGQESVFQAEVYAALEDALDEKVDQEVRIDVGRIDIAVNLGEKLIALELKSSGSRDAVISQCRRYCGVPRVAAVILVTTKNLGLPKELEGKPAFVVNLTRLTAFGEN